MQPEKKSRRLEHVFNRFILRKARERVAEKRNKASMGSFRGYVVPDELSRKLRQDSVATSYEKRGKLDRKTAEGGKRQFCGQL